MEDKLKELFDAFDEAEVDELLKDIKTDDIKVDELSAKRISKNVLKKTNAAHKWINKRVIAIVASAAVLVISVGIIGLVRNNNTAPKMTQPEAPAAEYFVAEEAAPAEAPAMDAAAAEEEYVEYEEDVRAPEEAVMDEEQKPNAPANKSVPGSIVDSSSSESKTFASDAENNIMTYRNMNSGDIEKTLDEAEYEIDYSGFDEKDHVTLADLEKECDYIVKGTKTAASFVSSEDPVDDNLKLVADFNIDEVITGDNPGESIKVNEGIRYNPVIDVLISSCEYTHMKNGKTYILFLKKSSDGRYDIAGGIFGKTPVDANEKLYLGNVGQNISDKKIEGLLADYKEVAKGTRKKYLSNNKNIETVEEPDNEEEPSIVMPDDEATETPEVTPEPESTPEPEATVH